MIEVEQDKQKKDFSIVDSIKVGWRLMREHLGTLMLVQLAGMISILLVTILSGQFIRPLQPVGPFLDFIIQILVQCLVGLAIVYVGLKIVDGQEVTVRDLFSPSPLILKYAVALICGQLAVILGLICFIIPGLILMVRFGLFGYFIVDKGAAPIESLRMSWDTVRGCSLKFFFFFILCALINLAGILCLGFGVLFTLPTTIIATALVYRTLDKQTKRSEIIEVKPS